MTVLSVIIPAYDEASTIASVIAAVAAAPTPGFTKEIIVVDDGSTDRTAEVARTALGALGPDAGDVLVQPTNLGKGTAVKRGFAHSTGDLVIVQDADLEYDPAEFDLLLDPVRRGRADLVIGSRFIGGRPRRVVYMSNAIGNRLMSGLFSMVSGLPLTDVHCCYVLLPGDLARASVPLLTSARWGFNPEICSLIADWQRDLRIVEVGISYYGRSKQDGKKIRMRHGVVAVGEILRFNLRSARPFPVTRPAPTSSQ
jgi:glycosyltransferase involved in cell wall biosynthesis